MTWQDILGTQLQEVHGGLSVVAGIASLVFTCGVILLLGGLTYFRNPRSKQGISFAIFSLLLASWIVANYFTSNPLFDQDATDLLNRLAYVLGYGVMLAGFLFTGVFPRYRPLSRTQTIAIAVLSPIFMVVAYSRLVAGSVYVAADGTLAYTQAPLSYLYAVIVGVLIVLTFLNLLDGYRHSKGRIQRQTLLILVAFIGSEVIGLISNVFVPSLQFTLKINLFTPLLTLILVGTISYAIIRHRLFDIRWVIARSLGYVLAVSVVATVYGAIVFGIAKFVFNLQISVLAQIYLALGTGIAGLIFARFQHGFNGVTNRIFYQDSYDTQELFDDLNRVLVSNIEVDVLLSRTSTLVSKHLKAEYCEFTLKNTRGPGYRTIGPNNFSSAHGSSDMLRLLARQPNADIVAIDSLEDSQGELKGQMQETNLAVAARFLPDSRRKQRLGFILLGPKKSGNPYTNKDLRALDTIANELVIAIQNALHFEEIQQFNDTLQARVDQATRELRRTNGKLQELDATKDDFIGMASHQLRTPLTSVKGYLSMLLEGDAGEINDTQRRLLAQAFVSSQRMVFLIADLLNVSRLKTGKFILDAHNCNLSKMVQEEVDQLQETAQNRDISLNFTPPPSFPDLMLDETKTRQVIMNFMDNAIYYTQPGGHIRLELADTPAKVELRVIDDGIGVPKHEQRHLFTKFYRAGNARKARPDGTGLGLFMAKKVVVAQGGSMIFDSTEGQGSTFGFSFPKAKLRALKPASKSPSVAAAGIKA